MDLERILVCKIISTGQLEEVLARGIRSDLFADDDCRDMFDFVLAHARRYGSPPSMRVIQGEHPEFEWAHVQDPLDYVVDRFTEMARRRMAGEMVLDLAKLCDDPKGIDIEIHFLEASRKLATMVPVTQASRFRDMDKRIEDYERKKKSGEKPGIPFGFPKLDNLTGGLQPHEFVAVAGFSGIGKSTLLLAIAFNMWVHGKTVLFISLEMEAKAILRRFDAMAASLDYRALRHLDLPEEMMLNWRQTAEKIREKAQDIPVIDSIRGCTVDHVYAETVRHNPDVVFVDYLSLMKNTRPSKGMQMWQSLTEITQDLKQNARTLKIPIVAAAQTNRLGAKEGAALDNIGYSLSVTQDPDIVLGLFADDEMKERKEMEIRAIKNRDGPLGRLTAIWDHENQVFREKALFERGRDEPEQNQNGQGNPIERMVAEARPLATRKKPGG